MTKQQTESARRILKNAIREELSVPIDLDDGYALCDGYRIVKTVENVALQKEDTRNPYRIMVEKTLEEAKSNTGKSIQAPTVKFLEDYIRAYRQEHKGETPIYEITEGVLVNAYYLKDIVTILKHSVIRFSDDRDISCKIIYFESPSGMGALLPVRRIG